MIKEYFANYFLHTSDVTVDLQRNEMDVHHATGRALARDAGRHRRATPDRRPPEARAPLRRRTSAFCLTYGDGVADVDIARADRASTARTASSPRSPRCRRRAATARWSSTATQVTGFIEKPRGDRRLDQRRLLRAVAARSATASRATTRSGSASRSSGLAARRASCMAYRPSRLLAADGHAARQEPARRALGLGRARPGRSGLIDPGLLARPAGARSPATPASRAPGRR